VGRRPLADRLLSDTGADPFRLHLINRLDSYVVAEPLPVRASALGPSGLLQSPSPGKSTHFDFFPAFFAQQDHATIGRDVALLLDQLMHFDNLLCRNAYLLGIEMFCFRLAMLFNILSPSSRPPGKHLMVGWQEDYLLKVLPGLPQASI
jgi:hypothetical protein